MGDLGVRGGSSKPRTTQNDGTSTALARLREDGPGYAQKALHGLVVMDSVLDKVPVVGFVAPEKPSSAERVTAGVMTVVYSAAAGLSFIPFVGPWGASALIAGGGALARWKSPNPEVQNQANLALQTSAYGAAAGIFGLGSVPYARAAIKSAFIAMNKG